MELAQRIDQGPARRRAQLLSRAVIKQSQQKGFDSIPPTLRRPDRVGWLPVLVGAGGKGASPSIPTQPVFTGDQTSKRWQIALGMDKGGRRSNLDHHLAQGNLPSHHWHAVASFTIQSNWVA